MATVAANSTTPASAPSRTPPPASARAATSQAPGFIGEPLSNSPSPLPSTVGRMPSATTSNSSSVKDHASFVGERAGHELRVICLKDPRALFAHAVAITSIRNFFDRIAPRPRSGARHRHSRCGRHGGHIIWSNGTYVRAFRPPWWSVQTPCFWKVHGWTSGAFTSMMSLTFAD